MKYSVVTCGECGKDTVFIAVQWPPEFFWCGLCGEWFIFEKTDHTNAVVWRHKEKPDPS